MRRFLLLLTAVASALTVVPVSAAAQARTLACADASAATYRHSFNGARGTSTITPLRPLCPGESDIFTLAAYTAPAPGSPGGLFIYDLSRATLTSGKQSVTLKVSIPSCFTHVYAVRGSAVPTETTTFTGPVLGSPDSHSTGPTARHLGGTTACTPLLTVTYAYRCDGSFAATVRNAPTASVPAVVTSGNRLTRVAPGRSTVLPGAPGTTMTFRASDFTTYVGRWRTPATPCPSSPSPSASPAALPTVPLAASVPPPPTVQLSAPVAATPEPPTFDPATATSPTAASAAEQPGRGMSTGSLLAIAFGLLLITGGGFLLARLVRELRKPL